MARLRRFFSTGSRTAVASAAVTAALLPALAAQGSGWGWRRDVRVRLRWAGLIRPYLRRLSLLDASIVGGMMQRNPFSSVLHTQSMSLPIQGLRKRRPSNTELAASPAALPAAAAAGTAGLLDAGVDARRDGQPAELHATELSAGEAFVIGMLLQVRCWWHGQRRALCEASRPDACRWHEALVVPCACSVAEQRCGRCDALRRRNRRADWQAPTLPRSCWAPCGVWCAMRCKTLCRLLHQSHASCCGLFGAVAHR